MTDLIGVHCFGKDNEYEQVLEFTNAVKSALEGDGWSPDLIDVQSFLWVHQAVVAESKSEKANPNSERVVPIWVLQIDPAEIDDTEQQSISFDILRIIKEDENWYRSGVVERFDHPTSSPGSRNLQ